MDALGDQDEHFAADLAAFRAAFGELRPVTTTALRRRPSRDGAQRVRSGRSAGEHASPARGPQARMRAARTAALRAESRPTHATGTPGGICTIESRASSRPRPTARTSAARR